MPSFAQWNSSHQCLFGKSFIILSSSFPYIAFYSNQLFMNRMSDATSFRCALGDCEKVISPPVNSKSTEYSSSLIIFSPVDYSRLVDQDFLNDMHDTSLSFSELPLRIPVEAFRGRTCWRRCRHASRAPITKVYVFEDLTTARLPTRPNVRSSSTASTPTCLSRRSGTIPPS